MLHDVRASHGVVRVLCDRDDVRTQPARNSIELSGVHRILLVEVRRDDDVALLECPVLGRLFVAHALKSRFAGVGLAVLVCVVRDAQLEARTL
ncbi:MAG: hypothetical protein KBT20_06575 [Bacteroidales bacterium]|nr:hypothetical protein [Candidatus Liminaster caballi]